MAALRGDVCVLYCYINIYGCVYVCMYLCVYIYLEMLICRRYVLCPAFRFLFFFLSLAYCRSPPTKISISFLVCCCYCCCDHLTDFYRNYFFKDFVVSFFYLIFIYLFFHFLPYISFKFRLVFVVIDGIAQC